MRSVGCNAYFVWAYSSAECNVDIFLLSNSILVSGMRLQSELLLNMTVKPVFLKLIHISQIVLFTFAFFLLRRRLKWPAIKKKKQQLY